ncbi:MAG: TetR family transcriptional regulator [Eubacteriales bacterium]
MASNKKGLQTKEYIYCVAKKLFYTVGYDKATLSLISKEANVPIGLIPYHFKNKDNILIMIYDDYLTKIHQCIDAQVGSDEIDNSILYHGVLSRIYYQIIFGDTCNRRVYHEVLKKKSNYRILHRSIGEIYRGYLKDFNIIISEEEFEARLYCDFGARREFFLHYLNEDLSMSIQDTVTLVNGIIPRLLGIDQNLVTAILDKSYAIYNSICYDDIVFLV